MSKRYKKAQGALEFLMTYGWAFLVILVMIGALAYFGVLNPTKFLPDKCTFGTEVTCNQGEYIINAAATAVTAKLVNQFGSNVVVYGGSIESQDITGVDNANCGIYLDGTLLDKAPDATKNGWAEGKSKTLTVVCKAAPAGLTAGEKVKIQMSFKWYPAKSTATFSHVITGEIFAAVQ